MPLTEFFHSIPGWAIIPSIIGALLLYMIFVGIISHSRHWIALACATTGVYQLWSSGAEYPILGVLFGLIPYVILAYLVGDMGDVAAPSHADQQDANNDNYQRRTREGRFR